MGEIRQPSFNVARHTKRMLAKVMGIIDTALLRQGSEGHTSLREVWGD
ncbi:MAG: hypothetical protein WAZ18_04390 [Alphaproteobacteria bacterium]